MGGVVSVDDGLRSGWHFVDIKECSPFCELCGLVFTNTYMHPPTHYLLPQQHARQTTTTNSTASACTPTLSSTGDAKTFLKEIGLRAVLEDGVARLLKVFPRPSSQREAWRVLSAQITRNFEQQDGGDSKYDAAVEIMLSVIVETLVRSLSRVAV